MKCLKCGTENKKDSVKCKKCGELLKEEVVKELQAPEVNVLKKAEIINNVEPKHNEKKKKSSLKKIWITIKIIIALFIIGTILLVVYAYGFYDYKKYFEENMNRYYETESEKYIENIKVMFRVYNYDDKKIEVIQEFADEIVNKWIDDLEKKDYKLEEEYFDSLNYLQDIINDLYNKTDVEGHTAISKKSHMSINYRIKDLLKENDEEIIEDNRDDLNNNDEDDKNNQEGTEVEDEEYEISSMIKEDVKSLLNLFYEDGTYVVYVGRKKCSYCQMYQPILEKAQNEYGYKTHYIDLIKMDFSSEEYTKLAKRLDLEYSMNVSGKIETGTFDKFFGYTPLTIIIKDGKQVDGYVGYMSYEDLTKMLEKNGITK